MLRTPFLLLFLLLSASVWAQELTIQGRIVDAETGEPLPYASIYVGEGRGTHRFWREIGVVFPVPLSEIGFRILGVREFNVSRGQIRRVESTVSTC